MRNTKKTWLFRTLLLLMLALTALPVGAAEEDGWSGMPAVIQLSKTTYSLQKGKRFRLKATVLPSSAGTSRILWQSSNKKVAKVSGKGKVRGLAPGQATITAYTADGSARSASCVVTVTSEAMKLSATQLTLNVGQKTRLRITPADGSGFVWASSDKSVATVSKKGKVKARKGGRAVIVAKRVSDGQSASCFVTVTDGGTAGTAGTQIQPQTVQPQQTLPLTTPQQPSALATKLLATLQKYSNQVQADSAAGILWKYNNSAPNTWKKARKAAKKNGVSYVNCALSVRWALREMGLLDSTNFWGVYGGGIEFRGNSKEQLLEHCEIIPVYKTAAQLEAEGNLLPGDICTYVNIQHTNVYAGNKLWYDSGRNGALGAYQGDTFVFNTFGPVEAMSMDSRIGYIIRLVR